MNACFLALYSPKPLLTLNTLKEIGCDFNCKDNKDRSILLHALYCLDDNSLIDFSVLNYLCQNSDVEVDGAELIVKIIEGNFSIHYLFFFFYFFFQTMEMSQLLAWSINL